MAPKRPFALPRLTVAFGVFSSLGLGLYTGLLAGVEGSSIKCLFSVSDCGVVRVCLERGERDAGRTVRLGWGVWPYRVPARVSQRVTSYSVDR